MGGIHSLEIEDFGPHTLVSTFPPRFCSSWPVILVPRVRLRIEIVAVAPDWSRLPLVP